MKLRVTNCGLRVDRERAYGDRRAARQSAIRNPQSAVGRAFTLLEVILAMSLSIVLLAALYTVLKLHLTYAQKAPQLVERSLKARAIVDRIGRDIRAVVAPSPAPQGSSGSSATGSRTSSGTGASSTGTSGTGTGTSNSSSTS